jgi:hypothetical protein
MSGGGDFGDDGEKKLTFFGVVHERQAGSYVPTRLVRLCSDSESLDSDARFLPILGSLYCHHVLCFVTICDSVEGDDTHQNAAKRPSSARLALEMNKHGDGQLVTGNF